MAEQEKEVKAADMMTHDEVKSKLDEMLSAGRDAFEKAQAPVVNEEEEKSTESPEGEDEQNAQETPEVDGEKKEEPASTEEPDNSSKEPKLPEDVTKELDNYKNLQLVYGRQAAELGRLRQQQTEVEEVLALKNDPEFAEFMLRKTSGVKQDDDEYFDPTDPKKLESTFDRWYRTRRQQEQQAEDTRKQKDAQTNFIAGMQTSRAKLIAQGHSEQNVDNAMKMLAARFAAGDLAGIALAMANRETDIEAAKKAGREEALRVKVDKQGTSAKRLGDVSSKGTSQDEPELKDMSSEELRDKIRKTSVKAPLYAKLTKEVERRANIAMR